eukprot:1368898-Pyramimonas_sp.AAC.1
MPSRPGSAFAALVHPSLAAGTSGRDISAQSRPNSVGHKPQSGSVNRFKRAQHAVPFEDLGRATRADASRGERGQRRTLFNAEPATLDPAESEAIDGALRDRKFGLP